MKYIVENWFVIVGLIAVLAAGGYTMAVRYETEQPYTRVMSQSSSLLETLANTATASPQGRDFGRTSI